MRFILTVILVFLMLCWFVCLVYMMANDSKKSQLPNVIVDYKLKWFYLALFIVLTVMIAGLFYFMFLGGVTL